MKGKGKGKEQSDTKDCPLQFPDFASIDHTRVCPRYTSALQKSEEEGIGVEDTDALQLELEELLVSVTKRRDQLDDEMQILVTWQDKKDKRPAGKVEPENSGKRCRPFPDGKPTKKYKDGNGKAQPGINLSRPKSKNVQQSRMQEYDFTDSEAAPRLPKNDSPNRFWASLENYCAEITQDDIKVIQDLIKMHDDDSEYQKIPPLGKHYSHKWSQGDIVEEQKEGSKANEKNCRKGLSNNTNSNTSLNSAESEKLFKKVEKEYDSEDTSPFGALTQRLVSCLIEENIITSLEDNMTDSCRDNRDGTDVESPPLPTKSNFIKSLNISNTVQLEKRIRKELEEHGILNSDGERESETENTDDEVLTELRKAQIELKSVSAHNLVQLKKMLKLAKEEMIRQDMKKKLASYDQEIMEISRKINSARQKKKSPTKKERDIAWKLLKERENLLKQIDNIGIKHV